MADYFVRSINQSNLQGVSATSNFRGYIVHIWNETSHIYNKNKAESQKTKEGLEIEKAVLSLQQDGVPVNFINLHQDETLQQKLISSIPGEEKIKSLESTYQSCEDMRRLTWWVLKQNKEKAWDAMRAHRNTLTDLIADSEGAFLSGDYQTYCDKLMNETKGNERFLRDIGSRGWWQVRGTGGEKIYRLVK
jgi:hypothetical protein